MDLGLVGFSFHGHFKVVPFFVSGFCCSERWDVCLGASAGIWGFRLRFLWCWGGLNLSAVASFDVGRFMQYFQDF